MFKTPYYIDVRFGSSQWPLKILKIHISEFPPPPFITKSCSGGGEKSIAPLSCKNLIKNIAYNNLLC